MLMLVASRFLDLSMLSYRENIFLAVIVLQLLILVVPTVFYAKLRGEKFLKRMRCIPFGIEKLLVTLLAAAALIFGDILIKLSMHTLGLMSGEYSVYFYYLSGEETNIIYSLLTFCIVPAVAEELLFRSVMCAEYEKSGVVTTAVASSVLYAMFGINLSYFPVYFFAGIIFVLVMYLTQSVFASMLCHLIYNVAVLSFGETVWNIITKQQNRSFLVFVITFLFLVCLSGLFSECERIYYGYSLANKNSDYAKDCPRFNLRLFLEALLAPPFLATALIFLVAAIQFS